MLLDVLLKWNCHSQHENIVTGPAGLFFFLVGLGLRGCARAFSSCHERGPLFVVVRGLLIAVASLVAEHGLLGTQTSVVVAHGLSSCGSRALEHRLSSCGTRA